MQRTLTKTLQQNQNWKKLLEKKLQTKPFAATASQKEPKPTNPQNLPNLPVPKLQQTLNKYLQTVKPFLNESEFRNTSEIVAKFESGLGKKLQTLLEERAKTMENWLADWWLKTAYLQFRSPVVVYSSPGQAFPLQEFRNENDRVEYAVNLVQAALRYKIFVDSGKMAVEKMGNDDLDMSQYNKVFGTCRIPGIEEDTLEFYPLSKHIVVVYNNAFYTLQVLDNQNHIINASNLSDAFRMILEDNPIGHEVGVLTSEHRDVWGKVYQELIQDSVNFDSVQRIQSSLFLVCLDGPMPSYQEENRQTIAGKQFIHGGGSAGNAGNRWYDKTIQFVIGQDGIVGMTYEHSPSEGQPIAVMTDYLVDILDGRRPKDFEESEKVLVPERLEFKINRNIEKAIDVAYVNIDKLADNLDLNCFTFKSFGKDFIKSQKLSPDSFIQMAQQYAFYRIHKVPGAHYESASLRKYIHGRTETIRSCSTDSVSFAQTMLDPTKSDLEKVTALRRAIDTHKQYCVEALNGYGVDRHLLGLKLIALENGLEVPELFKDAGFTRSAHMRISTSQVATKCDGFMCYGPLVHDGYACCYNPRPKDINFACSAFVACPETSASNFREALDESLMDMHNLLVKAQLSKL